MHGYGIVDAADRGMLLARSFLPRIASSPITSSPIASTPHRFHQTEAWPVSQSVADNTREPKTASSQRNVGNDPEFPAGQKPSLVVMPY